jgi:hypothetical protein
MLLLWGECARQDCPSQETTGVRVGLGLPVTNLFIMSCTDSTSSIGMGLLDVKTAWCVCVHYL